MNVYVESYGCTTNQHLGERLEGMLISRGFGVVDDPAEAHAIVVNTCTVKGRTQRRMVRRIEELQRTYGDRRLVVAGCMPSVQRDLVSQVAPDALSFGTREYDRIPEALVTGFEDVDPLPLRGRVRRYSRPGIGIVPVSSGCTRACAYCIVRLIKGRLRSRAAAELLEEVNGHVASGAHEIWLTSQDLAAYGTDGSGADLPGLIREMLGVPGSFRIRLGMMHPASLLSVLDEMLEVYQDERVYRFAHVPVQSGSDQVLESMSRGHTADDWVEVTEALRSSQDEFTISTDVIVGYPTERDDDFRQTIDLLSQFRPDIVNLSRYEPRPGTPASRMKQLPGAEVKRRSRRASVEIARVTRERNLAWIGWRGESLVSERAPKGGYVARNSCYKPIILDSKEQVGERIGVEVTSCKSNYLLGRRVKVDRLRTHDCWF